MKFADAIGGSSRSQWLAVAAIAGAVATVSCGSDSSGAASSCSPGKQESCACPGGAQGAQRCNDDGSGWDACQCPDSGAPDGAGGTGGTGGSSGNGGTGGVESGGSAGTSTGGGGAAGGPGPDDDPCPAEPVELDCSDQCGGPTALCAGTTCTQELFSSAKVKDAAKYPYVFRTPSHPGVDPNCEPACADQTDFPDAMAPALYGMYVLVKPPEDSSKVLKVTVGEPWWIKITGEGRPYFCLDWSPQQGCAVAPQNTGLTVMILTDDPNAPARNVVLDEVDKPGSCP